MSDTSGGSQRVRRWPRNRPGKPARDVLANQQKFSQTQKMMNYAASEQVTWLLKQVENSPLLPRDVFTMMMFARLYAFQLDNGRTIWPMAARTDVSDALDALGAQVGDGLVRTETGWTAVPGGAGGGGLGPITFVNFTLGTNNYGQGWQPIVFPNVIRDDDDIYNASTGEWTFKKAGIYLLFVMLATDADSISSIELRQNSQRLARPSNFASERQQYIAGAGPFVVDDTTQPANIRCFFSISNDLIEAPWGNYCMIAGPLT